MALLINSYSFVVFGSLIVFAMALLTWKLLSFEWSIVCVVAVAVFLGIFQFVLSTDAEEFSTMEDFDNALASGKPILLELYSNL